MEVVEQNIHTLRSENIAADTKCSLEVTII